MSGELETIIKAALTKFREIYGESSLLEDEEKIVFSGDNFTLIVSNENGRLKTEFLGDKVIKIDCRLSIYN